MNLFPDYQAVMQRLRMLCMLIKRRLLLGTIYYICSWVQEKRMDMDFVLDCWRSSVVENHILGLNRSLKNSQSSRRSWICVVNGSLKWNVNAASYQQWQRLLP